MKYNILFTFLLIIREENRGYFGIGDFIELLLSIFDLSKSGCSIPLLFKAFFCNI
jgi:hypothetical protein